MRGLHAGSWNPESGPGHVLSLFCLHKEHTPGSSKHPLAMRKSSGSARDRKWSRHECVSTSQQQMSPSARRTQMPGQPGKKRVRDATLSGYRVRPGVLVAGCLFPPARVSGFSSTDTLPASPSLISLQEEGKLPPFLFSLRWRGDLRFIWWEDSFDF